MPVLEKPPSQTLSNFVYDKLKNDIIAGSLKQGSKVKEEQIAKQFGISRGPLREAIQKLEANKLVVRLPRAGVRVVTLDIKMMAEIYQVREALEGMSVRLAAQNMTTQEIDSLWSLLDDDKSNVNKTQGKQYLQQEGNLDFHYRLASYSHNDLLLQLLGSELYQLLKMCRHRSSAVPHRAKKALNEHHLIVEAIANKDAELAEILMRRHISGAWKIVKETFK